MSHSVMRRYTPPTCTLELLANASPLSRWAGQPVLKNLRFQLTLDDPKLPKEQWVTLRGDRLQLEALCDEVQTYVQRFLGQSHSRLSTAFSALQREEGSLSVIASPPSAPTEAAIAHSTGIQLQPSGSLAHTLFLGSLATAESGPTTQLSTLQLFDLANALDEYATDVLALPTLERPRWLTTTPSWKQVAAASLLVVGLSASVVRLMDHTPRSTSTVATTSQGASSNDQRIANQLPPGAPTGTPSPGAPLASNQPLPPPPPPGSTVPIMPGMPTVAVPQAAPPANRPLQGTPQGTSASKVPINLPQVPGQPHTERPTVILGEGTVAQGKAAAPPSQFPAIAAAPRAISAPSNDALQSGASVQPLARTAGDTAREAPAQPGTAFDTIPQVAEARSYFQKRWQPPKELNQTLEYRLTVDAKGNVQSITPLGQAAGDYVDRTGIPLVGEPLVSPLKQGSSARMRLVLSPDGTVQTFLEDVR